MPGGPTSRKPRGILAPAASKCVGSWRNETISESSSTASSHPTTSSKRALGGSGSSALVAVKALALVAPLMPMAPFFDIQTKKPMIIRTGSSMATAAPRGEALAIGSVVKGIAAAWSSLTSSVPYWLGYEVRNSSPLSRVRMRTRLSSSMAAVVILWPSNWPVGSAVRTSDSCLSSVAALPMPKRGRIRSTLSSRTAARTWLRRFWRKGAGWPAAGPPG